MAANRYNYTDTNPITLTRSGPTNGVRSNSLITVAAPATQTPEARNKIDALDEESLELADESCRPLIVAAVKSGLEMPIIGFELQSGEILEAAWPQAKVAITLEDGSPDGWDCRMPDEWDVDSLRQALSQKE